MRIVNGKDKVALVALMLGLLGGVWLVVAPFLEHFQARGAGWAVATKDDVVVGVCLLVLSTAGLVAFAAGGLRELARRAQATETGRTL
jgi:hypothetical protein